jgi:hypothetical protein
VTFRLGGKSKCSFSPLLRVLVHVRRAQFAISVWLQNFIPRLLVDTGRKTKEIRCKSNHRKMPRFKHNVAPIARHGRIKTYSTVSTSGVGLKTRGNTDALKSSTEPTRAPRSVGRDLAELLFTYLHPNRF